MSIETPSIQAAPQEQEFEWGNITTIVGGHFIHDTFTAFVAPLLPLIIEKLSISLTQAGTLTAFMQLPSILNPVIGYFADRVNMRYFVIFAPAVTATLIGLMGFAPSYLALAFLFFLVGLSVASFHSPAPPMIANISGKRVGMGMSLFMAAGELGRTLGPIIAVSAVAAWGLPDLYRLIVIGWASSFIMLWRFRNSPSKKTTREIGRLKTMLPTLLAFFAPVMVIALSRTFLAVSVTVYLPTFLNIEGASLARGGIMLAILEAGGVVGAMVSGTISDRIGRKITLISAMLLSSIFTLIFLQTSNWLMIPVLLLLGFFSLAPQPVILALVQDHYPNNRALANGLYMSLSFLMRSLVLVLIGIGGDNWGLRATFTVAAFVTLLAIPAILLLPASKNAVVEV